jgi:hypothetical protein
MAIRKHLPSTMHIANNRVLVSYEGQPATCYGCGGIRASVPDLPSAKTSNAETRCYNTNHLGKRSYSSPCSAIPNIIQTSHSDPRIEGQGTTGNKEHAMQPQDTQHWPQIQHDITPVTAEAELTTESAQEITPPTHQEDTREATSSTQTVDANASAAEGTPTQPIRAQTHGEHSDPYECEGSVEALAAAPSIAEELAIMTENSTTLSDEDMNRPSYVWVRNVKKTVGAGGMPVCERTRSE